MNTNNGYQPNRSQHLMLANLIERRHPTEVIVVHYVLKDTKTHLHLQIERRIGNDISFERVWL